MNGKLTINFVKKDGQWHCYLEPGTNSESIPFEIFHQFLNILITAADKLNEKPNQQ